MQRRNIGQPSSLAAIFLGCYANVSVFSREIKEPHSSSKNKKSRERVDSRVQLEAPGNGLLVDFNNYRSIERRAAITT